MPDRFLVGLAVLSLLSEVAQQRPLLCVIDDAQWLDKASAQALAFVARRLAAESVIMLLAAEPGDEFAGVMEMVIEGLSDADARALLATVTPGRVADQFVAEMGGNPLALLELSRGLSTAQLASGLGLPHARSVQRNIEESFLQRVRALPEQTGLLLLVAAAEPGGTWRSCGGRLSALEWPAPNLSRRNAAGLVEIHKTVRFRHPLVRSAVYGAATPEQRRYVHRALAEATDGRVDPDRRAWHLADATIGPDEDVAIELDLAAARAQSRGGLAAAAAFLERAATLTPDPSRRAQRALTAAQTKYQAGAARRGSFSSNRSRGGHADGPRTFPRVATLFSEGYAAAVPILRRAESAFGTDGSDGSPAEELHWLWLAAIAAGTPVGRRLLGDILGATRPARPRDRRAQASSRWP